MYHGYGCQLKPRHDVYIVDVICNVRPSRVRATEIKTRAMRWTPAWCALGMESKFSTSNIPDSVKTSQSRI